MIQTVNLDDLRQRAAQIKTDTGVRLIDVQTATGIHPGTMSRFLNGGTPDVLTFARLCDWLALDPRQLYVEPQPISEPRARSRREKKGKKS